ncbi:MAG TPA: YaaR family protein [Cerasibacillus sp.]|uniref:YaaR family protein n=1 Tax=Cerasibacillus sp. TaxID=2498711 RepID=UPI002F42DC4E
MKITQDLRSQIEPTKKNTRLMTEQKHSSFHKLVQSQAQQLKQHELSKLMEDINLQGDRLVRHRSFRDLAIFKRLVRGFLKEAVSDGLELKKSHSFSAFGESRQLTIVKEVDAKLLLLTEEVLQGGQRGVDLLEMIGEIKGLLVNLYI